MLPPDTRPLHRWTRVLFWLNLAVEIGIVLTGGLVRLTGSGLGCPDWPQCVPGSLTPVAAQGSWHKYVEFGNRTLTGLVSFVAVALIVAVVVEQRVYGRRKKLVAPLLGVLAGIALQAIVGGISVHLKLNPWIVATHFLGSMVLVWASAWLVWRSREGEGAPVPVVRREVRALGWVIAALTGVVLLLGTLVTGAGPHSGDANAPARLGVEPRTMAWLHADAVMLYCGLIIGMVLAVRLLATSPRTRRAWTVVLSVVVLQGVVGYTQYFLGVPAALVLIHMLLASLLVVAVTWAVLSLRERAEV
ncbi:heme A synthase [Calidifontibacter sp. DB0510]|uniref:Heme A synthase n=1 Tax=Metallococcus carri TaxID=1656884 RepID=A0A967AXN9_9MICO|nr:COX15/CtaA family protein [Metallococcus carri]NHN54899.1 heme A synthase [Metallococcus carri]NOP37244.1 heme A synthase [Calidifontibacter sp. DB2511S]